MLFKGSWGSGAVLGRLGRPVGSRDPSLRLRRPILSVFGSKLGHPRVSKSSQSQSNNYPKIDAKIEAFFEVLLQRFWLTLGVFLGSRTLENECLV